MKDSKKGKLQQFKRTIGRLFNFLGKRHIWSGLLAGFLWAFSAPFVLSFQRFSEEAMWTLFFPLRSTFELISRVIDADLLDSYSLFMIWIMSIFVGMILGVACTYCIHRIRVWRRTRATLKQIIVKDNQKG